MPNKKSRREAWLAEAIALSYHYRGYEVAISLEDTGGLHVVVYSDDNAELVKRCDNVCEALNWIDEQTKDQVWED